MRSSNSVIGWICIIFQFQKSIEILLFKVLVIIVILLGRKEILILFKEFILWINRLLLYCNCIFSHLYNCPFLALVAIVLRDDLFHRWSRHWRNSFSSHVFHPGLAFFSSPHLEETSLSYMLNMIQITVSTYICFKFLQKF